MSLYIYFDRIITNLLVSSMLRLFLLNVYRTKVFVRLVLKIENIKNTQTFLRLAVQAS